MPTVLLVRHGLTALTGPVLAGWTPGVHLDPRGSDQAASLGRRLAPLPLAAIVSSPLERCVETAEAIAEGRQLQVTVEDRLGEARYGDWTGAELKRLSREPLWRAVQAHPSSVRFPGGEALRETQARAVEAVRDWNERLGADATYLVCSHADVIKSLVADAVGLHLDLFQRLVIDPCSVTVVRYTELRPFLLRLNDQGGAFDDLMPRRRRSSRRRGGQTSDAPVGGGSGQTG
jgi:probable phosphoglycerate mutase